MKIKHFLFFMSIVSLNIYAQQYCLCKYKREQHVAGSLRKTIVIPSSKKTITTNSWISPTFCDFFQQNIITIPSLCANYESLRNAAKVVNALAQTNKFLNTFINDSDKTLKLIKGLSDHFKVANIYAAKVLCTCAAKNRFFLQTTLRNSYYGHELNICKSMGADLDFTYTNDGHTLLLQCAARLILDCDFVQVQWLIENGADINRITSDGCNAAVLAMKTHNIKLMTLFLQHPALMINHQTNKKNTLLHWCIHWLPVDFMLKIMEQLLERGANPTLINADGKTPLDMAKLTNYKPLITLLEKATNDFNSKKKDEI